MKLNFAARSVIALIALCSASASATTLDIVGQATTFISFSELNDPSPSIVSGIFSGNTNGTGSFTIDASADTPASVFSIAFEGAIDPAVQAIVSIGTSMFTVDAGAPQLTVSSALLQGASNIFSVEITGATGLPWGLVATVSAVPLPAAAWLFLSALSGVLVMRRRRLAPVAA